MAFRRFIRAIADGNTVHLYGDGRQMRDFRYVDDVVEARLRAAACACVGEVINVGGGASGTVNEVLALLGELRGQPVGVEQQAGPRGDPPRTSSATERADTPRHWR